MRERVSDAVKEARQAAEAAAAAGDTGAGDGAGSDAGGGDGDGSGAGEGDEGEAKGAGEGGNRDGGGAADGGGSGDGDGAASKPPFRVIELVSVGQTWYLIPDPADAEVTAQAALDEVTKEKLELESSLPKLKADAEDKEAISAKAEKKGPREGNYKLKVSRAVGAVGVGWCGGAGWCHLDAARRPP